MRSGPILRDALIEAQKSAADVIVDLSDVTFMDSTGINALSGAYRRTSEDGSLIVTGAKTAVRRVFEVTGLEFLLCEGRPLNWHQVTHDDSGWRQWTTEDRIDGGIPMPQITELGAHGTGDDDGVQYALEYQRERTLFGSLEEAMRVAELLCHVTP